MPLSKQTHGGGVMAFENLPLRNLHRARETEKERAGREWLDGEEGEGTLLRIARRSAASRISGRLNATAR